MHRFALVALLAALATGCAWIHPSEPTRPLPADVAAPRFEPLAVDFAHHWNREAAHHLTGAAVLVTER